MPGEASAERRLEHALPESNLHKPSGVATSNEIHVKIITLKCVASPHHSAFCVISTDRLRWADSNFSSTVAVAQR